MADLAEAEAANDAGPASRALSFSARTPKAAHEADTEMALPTFIVDVESDCVALLDRLLQGDQQAEAGLLEMGDSAVSVLMDRFPGPITDESPGEGRLPASRRGPVLGMLARFGPRAVGPLASRAADSGAADRDWAIRLLGEIRTADSVRALLPLLLDESTGIRRAAQEGARLLLADEDARRLLQQRLTETAAYEAAPSEVRQRAIRALADLHEPQAVPPLARLLEQDDQDLAKEARRALVIIARQDFGGDARRWREWWKRNQARHRVEWLIDALTHDQSTIRLAAGEELKSMTKEYFGYYDDLPRKERARAQKRYRHWWETKGKALFRAG
jgi:HEAT repeat protein